jgi:hypothetical protein
MPIDLSTLVPTNVNAHMDGSDLVLGARTLGHGDLESPPLEVSDGLLLRGFSLCYEGNSATSSFTDIRLTQSSQVQVEDQGQFSSPAACTDPLADARAGGGCTYADPVEGELRCDLFVSFGNLGDLLRIHSLSEVVSPL